MIPFCHMDPGAAEVAVALFIAHDEAVLLALGFQLADDFADVLEAGQHSAHFTAVFFGDDSAEVAADDGADADGILGKIALRLTAGEHIIQYHRADFVAGHQLVAVGRSDGNAHAVWFH